MSSQEKKVHKYTKGEGSESAQADTGVVERGRKIAEKADELVEQIDEILEENAEAFLKQFVQRSGE